MLVAGRISPFCFLHFFDRFVRRAVQQQSWLSDCIVLPDEASLLAERLACDAVGRIFYLPQKTSVIVSRSFKRIL
jgi:hypothetical protein